MADWSAVSAGIHRGFERGLATGGKGNALANIVAQIAERLKKQRETGEETGQKINLLGLTSLLEGKTEPVVKGTVGSLDLPGLGSLKSKEEEYKPKTEESAIRLKEAGKSIYNLNQQDLSGIADNLISGQLVPSQIPSRGNQRIMAIQAAKEIDPSYNAAKADINFTVNKTSSGNFEKLYNNVTSFEKTFRKNADVALSLSDNFDRSKIPLVNRAIIAGKLNITGDPEASRLATAVYTVATEYARLTSAPGATGSMITDSAREEARNMLNTWQNQETLRGLLDPVTGIMSIDAKNRIEALNETRDEIQGQLSGDMNRQGYKSIKVTPNSDLKNPGKVQSGQASNGFTYKILQ